MKSSLEYSTDPSGGCTPVIALGLISRSKTENIDTNILIDTVIKHVVHAHVCLLCQCTHTFAY